LRFEISKNVDCSLKINLLCYLLQFSAHVRSAVVENKSCYSRLVATSVLAEDTKLHEIIQFLPSCNCAVLISLLLLTWAIIGWTIGFKMWIFKASASHPLHLQVTTYKLQGPRFFRCRSLPFYTSTLPLLRLFATKAANIK